jgi:hypothetical protein
MRDREWSPDCQQGPQALPGFRTGRTAGLHRELERDSDVLILVDDLQCDRERSIRLAPIDKH